jgi:hyperosmotically inducible protein
MRKNMKIKTKFQLCLLAGAALLMFDSTVNARSEIVQQDRLPAPDNTKANQGDANKGGQTADQQKMNAAHRATAKQIRAAIIKDKPLSPYVHNIKIITQNGKVTLKGPVRSDDENRTSRVRQRP